MKIISLILFSAITFSCNGIPKNDLENDKQSGTLLNSNTDNTDIFGIWSLCAEFNGKQMTQYNVCSTVIFKQDGSGYKIIPGGESEIFSWSLKKGKLKIVTYTQNRNKSFPDTNYVAVFKKNSVNINLEIQQIEKDYIFYLGRTL